MSGPLSSWAAWPGPRPPGTTRSDNREAGLGPGLEPTDEVRGACQSQLPQGSGGQAGRVTGLADDYDWLVRPAEGGMTMGTGGVEAPFEHIAFDHERPRDPTELGPLRHRADVYEQSAGCAKPARLARMDATVGGTGPFQQPGDATEGRPGAGGTGGGRARGCARRPSRQGAPAQWVSTWLGTRPVPDVE